LKTEYKTSEAFISSGYASKKGRDPIRSHFADISLWRSVFCFHSWRIKCLKLCSKHCKQNLNFAFENDFYSSAWLVETTGSFVDESITMSMVSSSNNITL